MIRSIRSIGYVLGLAIACSVVIPAQAQGKKGAEFIPGTVASIEKDKNGKSYKMKVTKTDNGEEVDVAITIRTPVFVSAAGDEGFILPGMMVETKAMKSNDSLFADDITIYLGSILPPSKVIPDKVKPTELFDVVGKILETQPDGIMVQFGNQPQKIGLEKGALTIKVKISDPSLIKVGDEVTVEGTMIKSKKTLNATMINVTQKEPITSAEYLATLEDKRKPKATAKSKSSAKAKADGEDATVPKSADPFGVLPGKTKAGAKSGTKESDKKDAAKESDKKEADTKEEAKKDGDKKDADKKDTEKKAD